MSFGYLAHHGILGMKWGVRRYQNEDGTLTEAGKRRLGQGKENKRVSFDDNGRISEDDRSKAHSRIHEEVANDYQNASSALNSGSQIASRGRQMAKDSANRARSKAASKIDTSGMTDKELQAAVNRMNLERSYRSLSTENVGSGRQYVGDILSTCGDILAIGASAAAIAVAIHQLKK